MFTILFYLINASKSALCIISLHPWISMAGHKTNRQRFLISWIVSEQ
jgi:hypothetical protein